MLPPLCILGFSYALCYLLTPQARALALGIGLIDRPDARRKLHGRPIPVAGGLAVIATMSVVLIAATVFTTPVSEFLQAQAWPLLGLLLGAYLLAAVGVVDDFKCLRGRHKILGQLLAVCVVMLFGIRINHLELFGYQIDLGLFAVPFTLLWLLGAINSLNLIDGMDGMLGCVGLILSLALCVLAILAGNYAAACVAAALAGALLGFLFYNLPPATIFMGDAGSMVVGLVLGVVAIMGSLKGPATVALIAPLAILTVPFLDTLAAVLRRRLTGRSIYATDRGHLHHCLLGHGYSTQGVLRVVSLFCLLTAVGAIASVVLKSEVLALAAVLAVTAVLVSTRLFGYAEYQLVQKRIVKLVLSFCQTRGAGRSQQLEVHLHGTVGWKALKQALTNQAFVLNLHTIRIDVSAPALHEEYHAQWERFDEQLSEHLWRVEMPLMLDDRNIGRITVAGYQDPEPLYLKLAALHDLIESFTRSVSSGDKTALEHTIQVVRSWSERTPEEIPVLVAAEQVLLNPRNQVAN